MYEVMNQGPVQTLLQIYTGQFIGSNLTTDLYRSVYRFKPYSRSILVNL